MGKLNAAYLNSLLITARKWAGSKRFSVYLYCLALATLIWFLMKFSGSFTSQLPVQVHYTVPSEDWYIINKDQIIIVDVKGFGFSLMWHKISGISKIEINLSNFEIKGGELDPFIVIPTEFLLSKTSQLFSEDESIDGIYPNILKVDLSQAVTKEVPIRSRIKLYPKQGYKLRDGLQLHPSNVKLFGPAFILSEIDHVNTKVDTLRDLAEDQVLTISLDSDSLSEWILSDQEIELKIDIDELTSGSIEVDVETRVEDPLIRLKVLPTKVSIFYQVGLEEYQLVNENLFKAYVTLPKEGALPEKLKVNISDIPDFVEVTRIDPPYVEFLLSKGN